MKKIMVCFFILSACKVFSQTDSIYRTDNIFTLSYENFDKKIKTFEDVKLISIDSISLSFEEIIYSPSSKDNKSVPHRIIFDKIYSFGYKSGMNTGTIRAIGAGVGFAIGFVLGYSAGKIKIGSDGDAGETTTGQRIGTGVVIGIITAIPAFLLTTLFSLDNKEYTILDISKYNRQEKFEIIKRLIKTGVRENE